MTYRNVLNEKIVEVAGTSIGGSPWADEVERSLSELKSTIGSAIDSDPILAEIFDRPVPITPTEFQGCPEHFGGCPECGGNDGFLNVGRSHWFICHKHKTKWNVGSNLFSSWRDQTEAEQREAHAKIENYRDVQEQNKFANGLCDECGLEFECHYCTYGRQSRAAHEQWATDNPPTRNVDHEVPF